MTWDYGGVARLQKQRDAVLEVQAIVKARVEPIVGFFLGKTKDWPSAQFVLFSLEFPTFFFVFFAIRI